MMKIRDKKGVADAARKDREKRKRKLLVDQEKS